MSDEFAKAAREAVEAADNTDQLKLIAAFLAAQQLTQQQTQPQPAPAPRADFNARKWLVIGGVVCAGGAIGSVFAVAFALAAISVAIGAVCATACLLILRSMWRDIRNR
ncbi:MULTISPECIES: hypothetical protein [unclassified Streptomyces]|uniref:hypothetical protein n=1 Tax=unclassified Streptomyces TaxID=2593676 RepID=UPI000FFE373C|nr:MULTISPECIES: hypothetical protein [unclassified Streptomyces]